MGRRYPYYHQRCLACGSDDTLRLGSTMASEVEVLAGKAGRTELVHCAGCGVSRFARNTDLATVLAQRRGRCGEYSAAMFHILEAVGCAAR